MTAEGRACGPIRLLGLSGSLRAASTNTALLRAAAAAAPEIATLTLFEEIGALPIFNPDLEEGTLSGAVLHLRRAVAEADGLVIASPEYAHGIPGGLKNALDWLVSGSEIPGKPVALFHASPRSAFGRAALAEVLRTMSTKILVEATVALLGLDPEAALVRLGQPDVKSVLQIALKDFGNAIRQLQEMEGTTSDSKIVSCEDER